MNNIKSNKDSHSRKSFRRMNQKKKKIILARLWTGHTKITHHREDRFSLLGYIDVKNLSRHILHKLRVVENIPDFQESFEGNAPILDGHKSIEKLKINANNAHCLIDVFNHSFPSFKRSLLSISL